MTSGPDSERDPLWSPDSHSVTYTVPDGKEPGIRQVVIGAGDTSVFADGKANWLDDWSRDGKLLVYHNQGGTEISVLPLSGDRKPQVVFRTPFQKDELRLSPDGRWVAYTSFESANQPEVYLAAFPSFTDRRQFHRRRIDAALAKGWRGTLLRFFRPQGDGRGSESRLDSQKSKRSFSFPAD